MTSAYFEYTYYEMGYFTNVPFCSIFVPFNFYLVITYALVVPCLDDIFIMLLLISKVAKIGATKPIFLDSGFPRGRGGACMCGPRL